VWESTHVLESSTLLHACESAVGIFFNVGTSHTCCGVLRTKAYANKANNNYLNGDDSGTTLSIEFNVRELQRMALPLMTDTPDKEVTLLQVGPSMVVTHVLTPHARRAGIVPGLMLSPSVCTSVTEFALLKGSAEKKIRLIFFGPKMIWQDKPSFPKAGKGQKMVWEEKPSFSKAVKGQKKGKGGGDNSQWMSVRLWNNAWWNMDKFLRETTVTTEGEGKQSRLELRCLGIARGQLCVPSEDGSFELENVARRLNNRIFDAHGILVSVHVRVANPTGTTTAVDEENEMSGPQRMCGNILQEANDKLREGGNCPFFFTLSKRPEQAKDLRNPEVWSDTESQDSLSLEDYYDDFDYYKPQTRRDHRLL